MIEALIAAAAEPELLEYRTFQAQPGPGKTRPGVKNSSLALARGGEQRDGGLGWLSGAGSGEKPGKKENHGETAALSLSEAPEEDPSFPAGMRL